MATCTAVRLSACTKAAVSQDARRPVSAMRAPVAARSLQQKNSISMAGSAAVQAFSAPMASAAVRAERMVVSARQGGRGRGPKEEDDGFEERVVQVRRVTKVVKGGKQMAFSAVVVVGNGEGQVGIGCAKAKEVINAVQKASAQARKELVTIKLTKKSKSLTHRAQQRAGGAVVMLRPAAEGTGVIAGGAVRVVLELAGVQNCFGKQLGSPNPLNNARATLAGLSSVRTFDEVAADRGITVEQMFA
eukprot:4899268-Pyramimonas_sp.AAC.1